VAGILLAMLIFGGYLQTVDWSFYFDFLAWLTWLLNHIVNIHIELNFSGRDTRVYPPPF
jgi:hypothetical protein